MATDISFKGVFPILVTPFDAKEIVDLESFVRVVRFMAEIGVDGVTILGVLGESNRMVDSEREQLIMAAVAAADGRIPVVVGTSHKGTQATLYLSMMAESLGASAVMMTPSKEAVPNEERIFEYFRKVANEINIPIVLQDHPGSTEVHLSAPLILRMVNEIPRIACIKQEAPPTPAKIAALISGMKERRVPILTGLGALYGMFDLERGSDGYMTGFAFPEVLISMVKAVGAGRIEEAWKLYLRFLPLIVFEQQPGIGIRKEIYRLRGLLRSNRVRHPGAQLVASAGEQLQSVIARILPGVDITKPLAL